MTVTLAPVELAGSPGSPLLVVGPSLGTSAATLWSVVADDLGRDFHVVGWDLPGHGTNRSVPESLTVRDLADAVVRLVDGLGVAGFHYAGDSVGGAVGLQLVLDHPERVRTAALLCTGAKIGTAESWQTRIRDVEASGTASLVAASADRWFGTGFVEREPERSSALLHALAEVDDAGYVAVCGALARHDLVDRLPEVAVPVLAVAGEEDQATPPDSLRTIADTAPGARLVVLPGVAHLAPIEAPEAVAGLVREHASGARRTVEDVRSSGMRVRREVLGDAHVDRATDSATAFTEDFQQFITEYAWGGIWTRPGLDRRSRSMITLTALIARGHHEELAMHVRSARTNGVSVEEIKEVILQSAIYCGVPDANSAFRIAQEVLRDLGEA